MKHNNKFKYKSNKVKIKIGRSILSQVDTLYSYSALLLKWVHKCFYESISASQFFSSTTPFLKKVEKVHRTRGKPEAIKFVKLVRLRYTQYLMGLPPLEESQTLRWLRPRIGKDLLELGLRTKPNRNISFVLTVLTLTRTWRLPVKVDTNSIEGLLDLKSDINSSYRKYLIPFWKSLGFFKHSRKKFIPKSMRFQKYHFTTKSGPNGHALWNSIADLSAIPDSLMCSLVKVGGPEFEKKVNLLRKIFFTRESLSMKDSLSSKRQDDISPRGYFKKVWGSIKFYGSRHLGLTPSEPSPITYMDYLPIPIKGTYIRKIIGIQDKEGKTREIAILDYFSQTVLKPVHTFLFSLLRKIPQDCTFDQGRFREKESNWEVFYSVDLTKATDRFPIKVISFVLSGLLPQYWISAWEDIMVGYPFYEKGQDRYVYYRAGNPMGAYSSWASFALAHHFIVFSCCCDLGIPWQQAPYYLLGDDIVLGTKALGELYIEKMTLLGVEVHPNKTFKSLTTFEFAKRIIHNKEEVTPFPLDAVTEVSRRYNLITNILIQEEKKGLKSHLGIPGTILDFYSTVMRTPRRFRRDISIKVEWCEGLLRFLSGSLRAGAALDAVLRAHNIPIPKGMVLNNYICENIIKECCASLFAKSNDPESGKGLGQLALNLVIFLTTPGIVKDQEDSDNLPSSIPLLYAHGLIEEMYLDVVYKKAFQIDTLQKGDWPLFLRALAIPQTDRIYSHRNMDLKPMVSGGILYELRVTRMDELRYLIRSGMVPPGELYETKET